MVAAAAGQRPQPVAETHGELIAEALRTSSLVNGHTQFHLVMDIHPSTVSGPSHEASPDMRGTMEVLAGADDTGLQPDEDC
jgi:hypothetical protein